VSRNQKGKTNLDLPQQEMSSEWQWHQLGHMQICTLLQTDNHSSIPTTQVLKNKIRINNTLLDFVGC